MRRYREGRRVHEYPFAFWRKSLLLHMSLGWKDLGYMFDGSSMIFFDRAVPPGVRYVKEDKGERSDEHTDGQYGSDA